MFSLPSTAIAQDIGIVFFSHKIAPSIKPNLRIAKRATKLAPKRAEK